MANDLDKTTGNPIDIIDEVLRPHLGTMQATSVAMAIFTKLRKSNLLVGYEDEGTRIVQGLHIP